MLDMNAVISENILEMLKETGKKHIDLANALSVSKQTMSKMLNGSRAINAVELVKIAEFFSVPMEKLTRIPDDYVENNPVKVFMDTFESDAAKEALEDFDKIMDMIIFHARVRANTEKMMKPWRG